MSSAAVTGSRDVGPLPGVGQAVWFEDLPSGPAEVRVEQVNASTLRTDAPRQGGTLVPLRHGSHVQLFYYAGPAPCVARATIIAAPPGLDGEPWLQISSVERTQRRGAVRVPVMLMARLRCDDPEIDCAVITEDMSSTGILLRADTAIAQASGPVELTVHFGDPIGDLTLAARVVRMEKSPVQADVRPWRVALQYVDLTRAVENVIVRFVFDRQREIQSRAAGLT